MRYDLRAMSIGGILDRALRIWLENFGVLLSITLAVAVPISLLYLSLSAALGEGRRAEVEALAVILNVILATVTGVLVQGALMQAVSDLYLGTEAGFGRSFRLALSRFFPLLAGAVLYSVAMVAGMMMCIVPYFIFAAAFFAVIPVVVLERKGPIAALGRSWDLTDNTRRRVFGAVFFSQLVVSFFSTPTVFLAGYFEADPLVTNAVGLLAQALAQPYTAVVTILLYYDLRVRREAFDLQVLSREIGGPAAAAATPL